MAEDVLTVSITQLVNDHYATVYRYAYRLTGSSADAEDLCQQVFLIAVKKLDQIRCEENARGWLLAVLRHHFLRDCRKCLPLRESDVTLSVDSFPADSLVENPVDKEQLQEALSKLPEGMRVVLMMFYFEELSYREIGEALALPIGTVMSRLSRAKSHLRALLTAEDEASPMKSTPREVRYG